MEDDTAKVEECGEVRRGGWELEDGKLIVSCDVCKGELNRETNKER